MKRKKKFRAGRIAALVVAGTLAIGAVGGGIYAAVSLFHKKSDTERVAQTSSTSSAVSESVVPEAKTASFTFRGVGDNLLHDCIYTFFEQDHGHRDYSEIYEYSAPYLQDADLAYINFETICAGDQFGLSGYPSFNGPLEMIDALSTTGIDWISVSSNHSMDAGMDGMITQLNYFRDHFPNISYTGAYRSEEEAHQPVVREINGIKVGLAGFTYGLNGYQKPEGADWLIDVYRAGDGSIDYALIDRKLAELEGASDVQIVAMHWGEEYHNDVLEEQQQLAQYLNSKGVEVIIGTHPHVIEPAEILHGDNQDTLVYYSLGNFLHCQHENTTMVGGMADFTLNYDFGSGKTTFSDVKFVPTVNWMSPDLRTYRPMTIHEYNDDWAANHFVTAQGQDLSKAWVQQYVQSVMGTPEGIEIVLE